MDININNIINKDDYFKFLNKNSEKCFSETYKNLYLLKIKKNLPKSNSNKQIKYLVDEIYDKKNITYLNYFLVLLSTFISFKNSLKLLNVISYSKKNLTDYDVLEYIDKLNKKKNSTLSLGDKCSKQEFSFELIKSNLLSFYKLKKNNKYLDIGCGDGYKTNIFAKIFEIDKKNIFGTDIPLWGPYQEKKNLSFNFKYILNDILDYKDNSFDIITCFLTLHHIQNMDLILNEIKRVLKKNGIYIIIEHDCLNYFDNLIIDIQHLFFSYFNENRKNYIKNPTYSEYYNNMEFQYILTEKHHYKLLYSDNLYQNIIRNKRYDQQFYAIYKNSK